MPPAKRQKAGPTQEPALILCYGDSNTFGQSGSGPNRLPYKARWTTVLQDLLGTPAYTVVPEGLNGRTTVLDDPAGSDAMLPGEGMNGRRYLLPCLHSHKPISVLVLALGCNDLKAKHYFGEAGVVSGLRALLSDVHTSDVGCDGAPPRVIVVSPPLLHPNETNRAWGFPPECEAYSRATIAAMATACKEDGHSFVDLSSIAVVGPDGIHFDASQGRPIATAIAEKIQRCHK